MRLAWAEEDFAQDGKKETGKKLVGWINYTKPQVASLFHFIWVKRV